MNGAFAYILQGFLIGKLRFQRRKCFKPLHGINYNYISLSVPTYEVMEEVGSLISISSEPSDVLFLTGDLGSGKVLREKFMQKLV